MFCAHLGVVVDTSNLLKSLGLYFVCGFHTFSYNNTTLPFSFFGQFVKRNRGYFNMNVYSIQHRTRYFPKIALHFCGRGCDGCIRVAKIPSGTRIQTCNQHKTTGIGYRKLCTGNGYFPFFHGLTHHFQYTALKFR